jgi:hypothetical protein
VWKLIGDLSVFHWIITITPGLVAAIAGRLHGMPLEVAVLWFVGISALVVIILSYLKKPSGQRPRYWRLAFPVGAVVLLITLPLFVREKAGVTVAEATPIQQPTTPPETPPATDKPKRKPAPSKRSKPKSSPAAPQPAPPQPAESPAKEDTTKPSVPEQQPTFSVTNPSGSIINQGSTVQAPQTVNNYGPPKIELNAEGLRILTDYLRPFAGQTLSLFVHNPDEDSLKLRDQFLAAFKENKIQLSESSGEGTDIPPPPYGVSMAVGRERDKNSLEVQALARALVRAGLVQEPVNVVESGKQDLGIIIASAR